MQKVEGVQDKHGQRGQWARARQVEQCNSIDTLLLGVQVARQLEQERLTAGKGGRKQSMTSLLKQLSATKRERTRGAGDGPADEDEAAAGGGTDGGNGDGSGQPAQPGSAPPE